MLTEARVGKTSLLQVIHPRYAGEERLWKMHLGVPEELVIDEVRKGLIVDRLKLRDPSLEAIQRSVEESNRWLASDGHMIEIPDFKGLIRKIAGIKIPGQAKRINPTSQILLMDMDDTLLRTTAWHDQEYKIIGKYLRQRGVEGEAEVAAQLYELSKIFVPGVAEVQARYTPIVNLILIARFIERQKENKGDTAKIMQEAIADRECLQRDVVRMGEGVLDNWAFDKDLLSRLIETNPTSDFTNTALIKDLFNGESDGDLLDDSDDIPDSTVRIVITRGKIEGPLGQVYKVHQSGLMTLPNVDMVIYTNDVKVKALLGALKLFPNLARNNEGMILYDDNPSEIVPFYEELARGPCSLNIEVVQVRNADSKRRDKQVVIKNDRGEDEVQASNASTGYAYSYKGKKVISIEDFNEVPAGASATIFDAHALNGRATWLA